MFRALISALALAPTTVAAQSADWDVHRDARTGIVLAYTQFDSGLGVGFRCSRKSGLNAVVSGLPPATQERFNLRVGFNGEEAREYRWTATTDPSVAVADYPAALAREFRQGGDLELVVPGGAASGADLAHRVTLPASSSAIDTVLTECGKPLVDPRDADLEAAGDSGLTGGVAWLRQPRPSYPETRYASGYAVITCLTQPDGGLRACETEMEHPFESGFGDAALRSTRNARVRSSEDPAAPPPLRRIGFVIHFRMR